MKQQPQYFLSPAKLNLMLHITGQRADGYHNLQTVFQLIDLCDNIRLSVSDDTSIKRIYGNDTIPEQDDLLVKAAYLIREYSQRDFGVSIGIDKKIPSGGGLGGGSSNAATVLLGLNYLLDLNVPKAALLRLAKQLGADVPLFVFARTSWAQGIGEQLDVLELPKKYFLVLHPQIFVSTGQLFSSSELTRDCSPITIRAFLEGEGKNVFLPLVLKDYKEVKKAFDWLNQFATAKLTGTGACLFAEFETKQQALLVKSKVPVCWNSWVATSINESPLYSLISQVDDMST